MSKQPQPAPNASAIGPCPTIIQIVGRPGTGRLRRTIAPPDHPVLVKNVVLIHLYTDPDMRIQADILVTIFCRRAFGSIYG